MYNVIAFFDFSITFDANNQAHSAAGDQVQNAILNELNSCKAEEVSIICVSHNPFPSWPTGPIYVKGRKSNIAYFPGYINIPLLKELVYSLRHIFFIAVFRPRVVVKYNIGLLDAISVYLMRLLFKNKIALIIQDIVLPEGGGIKNLIKRVINFRGARFARNFDLIIPISDSIAKNFDYSPSKTIVFRGGATRQTREIIEATCNGGDLVLLDRAIFAGALESYNGIDFLIDCWIKEEISLPLFVFGNGSLRHLIIDAQEKSRGKIIYMGVRDESTISKYLISSKINICLRYPIGIKEEYFFPSKFFNVCAAPGMVICNHFKNIPLELLEHCVVFDDNIQAVIMEILKLSEETLEWHHKERVKWIHINGNWSGVVKAILHLSGLSNDRN